MLSPKLLCVVITLACLPELGVAQGQCEVTPSFTITIVSSPAVCADRTGSAAGTALFATFNFAYKSVGGNPTFSSQLDGDFPCVNSFENRTIEDNTILGQVIVECRITRDSTNVMGAHAVSLKAEYDGVFPCPGGIEIATATVMVDAPAELAVTAAPAQTDICPGSKTFSVVFSGIANPNAYIGDLTHSAVLDDAVQCATRADKGAVGIVTSIAATCTTKNPEGFTAGNHILTLQAAAANTNLTGCAAPDAKTLTALVVVLNPPTIAMSPVKLQDATCSNSRNINVRFNYEVIDGGSSPILSVLGATPRLQGSNVRPGAAQQIKCKPTLQAGSSTKGQILVTCSGDFASAGAATITVQAELAATCSFKHSSSGGGGSAGLARRILALPPAAAAAATDYNTQDSEPSVTTVYEVTAGSAGDHRGGRSDASNGIEAIARKLGDTTAADAESSTPVGPGTTRQVARSRHSLSCCLLDVMAYAFASDGKRRSKCFKHTRPGAGRCTQSEGFYNQGPMETAVMRMVPQTANLQRPTTPADCAGGVDVGTVTATCPESRIMEIRVQTRRVDTITRQLFYVDCVPPRATQCPNSQWMSPGPPSGSDAVYRYTTLVVEVPSGCTCSNAYWAVYELGTFRGLPSSDCDAL